MSLFTVPPLPEAVAATCQRTLAGRPANPKGPARASAALSKPGGHSDYLGLLSLVQPGEYHLGHADPKATRFCPLALSPLVRVEMHVNLQAVSHNQAEGDNERP